MAKRNADMRTGAGARILVERMGEAASNFLASLAPDQRAKGVFDFANEGQRTRWYYIPRKRDGLPLAEMDRRQQRLAHRLVATGLSRAGYVTASTIIGLETTLDALEDWSYPETGRDPGLYYMSIFGIPHAKEPWGWRFEGHHLSLNYTIVEGRIVAPTPTFFGTNPAEVALGDVGILRPLGGVEDMARELVYALSEEQRATAVFASAAPPDIIMENRPKVVEGALPMERIKHRERELGLTQEHLEALRYTSTPKGLAAAAMGSLQREVLMALIREYIDRMPEEIAEIEAMKLKDYGLESIHFAWAGGLERGQPHYYRLQGSRFLVEYDNTQNDANHIHSVWSDPTNDFGADLLAQHYVLGHRH